MKIATETRVNIGGLMRCCTGTLDKIATETPDAEYANGAIIQCMYTGNPSHSMVLRKGVWHWNHPPDLGYSRKSGG